MASSGEYEIRFTPSTERVEQAARIIARHLTDMADDLATARQPDAPVSAAVPRWCGIDGCYGGSDRHEVTALCDHPRNTAIRIAREFYEVRQRQWPPDARVDWDTNLTPAQRADEANAVQDLLGRRVIRPGS